MNDAPDPARTAGHRADAWTAWAPLPWTTTAATLAETLDGGQAFRWRWREEVGAWQGHWAGWCVRLRIHASDTVEWSGPATTAAAATAAAVRRYLALDTNQTELADALPWRGDEALAAARRHFPGLRILRQPCGETLLCFLCSATKQIAQIRRMTDALAERLGAPLAAGTGHRLPTWAELAEVSEAELRACGLGFRARYVHDVARQLRARPGWLEEIEMQSDAAAFAALCALPGVGAKIAHCVLLFGAGRLQSFPIDVWIARALRRRYGLDGWTLPQLAQFAQAHFQPAPGLAQQYLFAHERSLARRGAFAPGSALTAAESAPPRSPRARR